MKVDQARLEALKSDVPSTCLYYLTGTQMFTMMKNVSESLAGRVGIIDMYGLSYSKIKIIFYLHLKDVKKESNILDQKH